MEGKGKTPQEARVQSGALHPWALKSQDHMESIRPSISGLQMTRVPVSGLRVMLSPCLTPHQKYRKPDMLRVGLHRHQEGRIQQPQRWRVPSSQGVSWKPLHSLPAQKPPNCCSQDLLRTLSIAGWLCRTPTLCPISSSHICVDMCVCMQAGTVGPVTIQRWGVSG